jgi:hypothetical protein
LNNPQTPASKKNAENTNQIQLGAGEAPKILNPAPKNNTPAKMFRIAEIIRLACEIG